MRKIATIIGGNGLIENYLVERLVKQGYVIRLAVPFPAHTREQKIFGNVGQVTPLFCSFDQENTIVRSIEGASVVINLAEAFVGKSKGNLEKINVKIAEKIAKIASAAGVKNLLHFSALGADSTSPSSYLVSKKKGEETVLKTYPSSTIVRVGISFGPEDQFLNKLGFLSTFFPIMPVYNVNTRLQPVYAGDIADAVIKIVESEENHGEIYELAGPEILTNRELISKVLKIVHRKNDVSGLCPGFIKLMAYFLEYMPGSLMTARLVNLMKYDSVASHKGKNFESLGIVPSSIEMIAPAYLYCYRPACDFEELKKLQKEAYI